MLLGVSELPRPATEAAVADRTQKRYHPADVVRWLTVRADSDDG